MAKPAPARPDLILLPGFMCDDDLWSDILPGLADIGDCRFGDLSASGDLDQMTQSLAASLTGPTLVIGFSMGGFAARKLALLAPDLVQGLVIINSSARGDTDVRRERNRVALAAQETRTYRGISRKALSRALHPDIETNKALIERLHAMSIRLGRQAFLNQLSIRRKDERPALGNISCPTLVVTGDQDRLRGIEEAEELRDGIPNATLTIIPDCGHMTPVEQPAALLKAIRDWHATIA